MKFELNKSLFYFQSGYIGINNKVIPSSNSFCIDLNQINSENIIFHKVTEEVIFNKNNNYKEVLFVTQNIDLNIPILELNEIIKNSREEKNKIKSIILQDEEYSDYDFLGQPCVGFKRLKLFLKIIKNMLF